MDSLDAAEVLRRWRRLPRSTGEATTAAFRPIDIRISLMAHGPDFKSGLLSTLPTANVDIAPTVAHILNLSMPYVQGRVLEGALKGGPTVTEYTVLNRTYRSSKRSGLTIKLPTNLDSKTIDPNLNTYSVELRTKALTKGDMSFTYFDQARAVRE